MTIGGGRGTKDRLWRRGAIKRVHERIQESIKTKQMLNEHVDDIVELSLAVARCLQRGGKVILFGNGGSAADAQHIAAEFTGRYLRERAPLPALALTVNTSTLTAIANDYGYEHVFERQVESACRAGDVVIGMSTSGNSKNVLLGVAAAKKAGATTVGMTGNSGGRLASQVDIAIKVPSESTPRIQECHILIGHLVSEFAEEIVALGRDTTRES